MEKIFVNGLISKDIPETAPEWILGKHSIKVDDLIKWLEENKHLADENGWINTITKRSQTTGKRFIEVDTWKPQKQEDTSKDTELAKELEAAERMRQEALQKIEEDWKASGHGEIPF